MTDKTLDLCRATYRQRYWDDCFGSFTTKHFKGPKGKALTEFFTGLYFGEPFRFNKKLLTNRSDQANFNFCFLSLIYQHEQNETVWQNFFINEAPKFGLDTFEKQLNEFDPFFDNPYFQPKRWGWSPAEDLEFFRFWWGECYEPESYHFLNTSEIFPYSAADVSSMLAAGMTLTLSGTFHHECRYAHLYDYWKQALLTLDPAIFYPESHLGKPCFSSLDAARAEALVEVKTWVASLLRKIHLEREYKQAFRRKKYIEVDDYDLPSYPYGMEIFSADEYWQLPNLVALRQKLFSDIESGGLPESIAALSEWASHPESVVHSLTQSTKRNSEYRDPARIVTDDVADRKKQSKRKEKVNKPDLNQEIDELVIPVAMVKCVGPRLEKYREALRECKVPTLRQPVDNQAGIKRVLKANQVTGAQGLRDLGLLSSNDNALDYLRFLIPQYIMVAETNPFNDSGESEIISYYRKLWQGIRAMTVKHKKMRELAATLQQISEQENQVLVKFTTEDRSFEFAYSVRDDYFDDSVIDDIATFHEQSALPWRFFQGSLDDALIIYYLPERAHALLPDSPGIIA